MHRLDPELVEYLHGLTGLSINWAEDRREKTKPQGLPCFRLNPSYMKWAIRQPIGEGVERINQQRKRARAGVR